MPTYAYHCVQCKHTFDTMHKITDQPLKICPQCGHETLRRGPGGGIGVAFRGASFSASSRRIETEPCVSGKAPGCCPCKGKDES